MLQRPRKLEIVEIQIIQKNIINKKLSIAQVAIDNGLPLSKFKKLLKGELMVRPEKIDNLILYVSEIEV